MKLTYILIIAATFCLAIHLQADVVNGDFNAGDSGFTTGYTFISSGTSTSPGTFGIRTNSQDFNPGYDLFADHTTGTGEMMLLDGVSGTTAWQEILPVTANTSYFFSAWATPANSSNPAGLIFSINGIQVGSTLVLSNAPGVWQHFTATWNSGSATSATIAVADNNNIALGNDFALDDFSFSTNSIVTATIYTAVGINWQSQSAVNYQVQYAATPNPSVWLNLGAPVSGTGTNNSVFDSTRGQPAKFYRVITVP